MAYETIRINLPKIKDTIFDLADVETLLKVYADETPFKLEDTETINSHRRIENRVLAGKNEVICGAIGYQVFDLGDSYSVRIDLIGFSDNDNNYKSLKSELAKLKELELTAV